jgi:hypothetical protein
LQTIAEAGCSTLRPWESTGAKNAAATEFRFGGNIKAPGSEKAAKAPGQKNATLFRTGACGKALKRMGKRQAVQHWSIWQIIMPKFT